jgi:uncharacterized protein YmfQ (DUF2313 family)
MDKLLKKLRIKFMTVLKQVVKLCLIVYQDKIIESGLNKILKTMKSKSRKSSN